MTELDPLFKVVILDHDTAERRRLVGFLAQSGLNLALLEASGEREAMETLLKEQVAIVFIGAGYPLLTQQQILARGAKSKAGQNSAFIVVTSQKDRQSVLSLIRAGASGVLLTPLALEPLNQTIETALRRIRESDSQQVNSLPWILEGVARRLEALALQITQAEDGSTLPPTTKQMQEALLIAFSGKTDEETDATARAAKRLARQRPPLS